MRRKSYLTNFVLVPLGRVTTYKVNHFNKLGHFLHVPLQTGGSEARKNLRIPSYCRLAWSGVDVPTSLVTVTATEAIDWSGLVPAGRPVPVRVKGIEISNCPPNASDAVL